MKLLLDQNLSFRLLPILEPSWPGSAQARMLGLDQSSDTAIWDYAREHGFTIVSKDSDFYERSLLHKSPPKILWLKCGNVPTRRVAEILVLGREAIESFLKDPEAGCLQLY